MRKKFLALIGSPRPNSTSGHLGQYLVDGLTAQDWQAQALSVGAAVRNPEHWLALETAFREADVVAIVSPLYVDSLPAPLTLALERLVNVRTERSGRLFAVFNCGFYEAHHNDVALDICRLFARDAGLHWTGGLAIGAGGMFAGQPLKALGRRAQHITMAFDQTLAALDAGQDIPESAITGIRKQVIPAWAYFVLANLSMLAGAAKHGVLWRIGARPYARLGGESSF